MTTTEELRRLLDERGIEWTYGDGTVSFSDGKHWCHAWAYSDGAMCVSMGYFTPEQAIDATLGRGTCHDVALEGEWFECSTCGCVRQLLHPNFCPNCGRKVVDE